MNIKIRNVEKAALCMNSFQLSNLAAKFPIDRFRSAGAVSIHGMTAARLYRLGYLERRMKDLGSKVSAYWEYRRIGGAS